MADATAGDHPLAQGSRWRHWKGGTYEVVAVATDADDGHAVVVYRDAGGRTWTRPLSQWRETVEVDGRPVARFAPTPDR